MSKPYNLENIDDIVLQKTFEYHKIRNTFMRVATRIVRRFMGVRDDIKLREVYNYFAQNKQYEDVEAGIEGITPKTILLARAFYMAVNPERHHKRQYRHLRVLCDANVDESYLTDGARQIFGYATHINFEGLTHAKDSKIWAVSNGRFNMIVTKDRAVVDSFKTMDKIDLTRCAMLRWKTILKNNGGQVNDAIRQLPVLVQIKDSSLNGTQIKNLLRKHKSDILELYDERVSPVIEVHKNTVKPGIHFLELIEGGTKERSRKLRDAWVSVVETALFKHVEISPESQKHIRASLKRAIEHHIGQQLSTISDPAQRKAYFDQSIKLTMDDLAKQDGLMIEKFDAAVKRPQDPLVLTLEERYRAADAGMITSFPKPATTMYAVS